ncbi:MAG: septal ring lytic transglycosylase RlpA family protein [Gammaproteobacteria bacterium]|jgi:rare lipoprotein A
MNNIFIHRFISVFCLAIILLLLNACVSVDKINSDRGPISGSIDVSKIPNAIPKNEPKSKYGNPASYVVFGKTYYVLNSNSNFVERGIASWYGEKFHGRRTSSGETYDMYGMTAAHKSLPLPTYVEVKNLNNGKKVILKVNDRGPFHENRIIDLSYTAAAKLDVLQKGTALVEVRSINPNNYGNPSAPIENPQVKVNTNASGSNTGFYIQVGAYSELNNAINMRKKLDPIAKNLITISESLINNQIVYRVRFGPISDITYADDIVESLRKYEIFDHYITLD